MVHSYSSKSPGKIDKLIAVLDRQTEQETKRRPKKLTKEMSAKVQIKLNEYQCLELYENIRALGKIVIRKETHTIAAGKIIELIS